MSELTGAKLQEEVDFIKRHLAAINAQKIQIPIDFVLPPNERPKRVHPVEIPVGQPPKPSTSAAGSSTSAPITLKIKSIGKPSLAFTLSAPPTSTISDLKAQLASEQPTAPPPTAQSWLIKGKALADSKLLKEYDVKEGDSIILKIRADANPPAPAAASSTTTAAAIMSDVPSPATGTGSGHVSRPSLSIIDTSITTSSGGAPTTPGGHSRSTSRDIPKLEITPTGPDPPSPTGRAHSPGVSTRGHRRAPSISDEFVSRVADSTLWKEVLDVLTVKMNDEKAALRVWEAWFESSKSWLSASQIAKIRDDLGLHGLGGL